MLDCTPRTDHTVQQLNPARTEVITEVPAGVPRLSIDVPTTESEPEDGELTGILQDLKTAKLPRLIQEVKITSPALPIHSCQHHLHVLFERAVSCTGNITQLSLAKWKL